MTTVNNGKELDGVDEGIVESLRGEPHVWGSKTDIESFVLFWIKSTFCSRIYLPLIIASFPKYFMIRLKQNEDVKVITTQSEILGK